MCASPGGRDPTVWSSTHGGEPFGEVGDDFVVDDAIDLADSVVPSER